MKKGPEEKIGYGEKRERGKANLKSGFLNPTFGIF
jgi:hypothetical protein